MTDENKIPRSLQPAKYDNEKTLEMLKVYLDWQASFDPTIKPEHIQILNEGGFYILGRDRAHRPCFWYNVSVLKTYSSDKFEVLQEAVIRLIHFCLTHLLLPGKVENYNCIFDLTDVGLSEIPVRMLKNLMTYMSHLFKSRVNRSYVVNAGWVLRSSWNVFSKMVDELARTKIILTDHTY